MSRLQNFILSEELRLEHAERFVLFQERYHHQIFVDLKNSLSRAWEKEIVSLKRTHKINQEDVELLLLDNPKAQIDLSVSTKTEKIVSNRHRDPFETVTSVKIPLLYSHDVRDLMIKKLIETAKEELKQLTLKWSEIFKVEKQGRAKPWFKILDDHDEVRLQLSLSSGSSEMYKTLYSVRTEYGKSSSRTKDFDRVYLVSLL